jgi:pyruvate formate lyase activating enzyme
MGNGRVGADGAGKYGFIHSTESFGSVDGPGVRFVVFMQGCRMACQYCHNPDTQALSGGVKRDAQSLVREAETYRSYWGADGGLTASGGEPLLQLDFLLELFQAAHKAGMHTALDTAGEPFTRSGAFFETFTRLLRCADLFLLDIKHIDDGQHQRLTGKSNAAILDMARFLSESGKALWIRHVLVPGFTDDAASLARLRRFVDGLATVEKIELLPYHRLGVHKWRALGRVYPLADTPEPSADGVRRARAILGID